jgi:hypothetical protein
LMMLCLEWEIFCIWKTFLNQWYWYIYAKLYEILLQCICSLNAVTENLGFL